MGREPALQPRTLADSTSAQKSLKAKTQKTKIDQLDSTSPIEGHGIIYNEV